MSKSKNVAPVSFVSVADLGYKAARAGDELQHLAALALDNVPAIAAADSMKDIEKDVRDEFAAGARVRWNEIHPPVEYAIVSGNYILMDALDDETKVTEKVSIGAEVAFALSQQEFGGLKENEPQKHAIIKDIRDRCNNYCSNRFKAIFAAAKQLQRSRNGESKTRQQALAYATWLEKILDDMKTRVISAESRGDATADKAKLNAAVIAFKTKYFN
jgi:hypothetical protein